MSRVTDTTPYTKIPAKHRDAETAMVEEMCRAHIPKGTPVVEFFGGMGMLAEVFNRVIEPTSFSTCEMDEVLYKDLAALYGAQAHFGDTFAHSFDQITPGCFVSLDYNKFTTLQFKRRLDDTFEHMTRVAAAGARWVQIADCSGFRFHLNHKAYTRLFGMPVTCAKEYAQGVAQTFKQDLGWEMIDWRQPPGAFHWLFELPTNS